MHTQRLRKMHFLTRKMQYGEKESISKARIVRFGYGKKRVFEWSENAHCALSRRWKQALRRKPPPQQDDSVHITNETVENCANSICISRQFEYAGDPSQMRRRPTEQAAEHCQLQTAAKSQVGLRHMRTMFNQSNQIKSMPPLSFRHSLIIYLSLPTTTPENIEVGRKFWYPDRNVPNMCQDTKNRN